MTPVTRGFINVLLIGALGVVLLPGCAGLAPQPMAELKLPANLSEAGKEAQKLIREVNVAITAAYLTVATNVEEGTMSVEDQTKYLVTLDEFATKADAAQAALNLGNIADAKSQAEVLNKLVLALHKKAKEKTK